MDQNQIKNCTKHVRHTDRSRYHPCSTFPEIHPAYNFKLFDTFFFNFSEFAGATIMPYPFPPHMGLSWGKSDVNARKQ